MSCNKKNREQKQPIDGVGMGTENIGRDKHFCILPVLLQCLQRCNLNYEASSGIPSSNPESGRELVRKWTTNVHTTWHTLFVGTAENGVTEPVQELSIDHWSLCPVGSMSLYKTNRKTKQNKNKNKQNHYL